MIILTKCQAHKVELIRRKSLQVKHCPFCAKVPEFEFKIQQSGSVHIGHYAVRRGCCKATALGQTELFFHGKPAMGTFISMAHRLINDWNRRESEK